MRYRRVQCTLLYDKLSQQSGRWTTMSKEKYSIVDDNRVLQKLCVQLSILGNAFNLNHVVNRQPATMQRMNSLETTCVDGTKTLFGSSGMWIIVYTGIDHPLQYCFLYLVVIVSINWQGTLTSYNCLDVLKQRTKLCAVWCQACGCRKG